MTYVRKEIIGDCTLYQADCADVMPTLGRFDACITDPPYGIAKKLQGGGGNSPNFTKLLKRITEWDKFALHDLVRQAVSMCDESIVWGGNYFELPPSRMFLVWDKGMMMRGRSFAECEQAWCSMDKNARLITLNPPQAAGVEAEKVHPTQKPLALMKWCLTHVPNAKTIFDPFMGSGTTGVACVQAGLSFTGIERDAEYFDIACKRIEAAYAQPDLFIAPIEKKQNALLHF